MTEVSYRARGIITKTFSRVSVLRGIDFEVKPGTIHGLFGHNGAGKSTLLKILAGAQPQDGGELSIGGEALTLASPRDALAKGIGCVYQELRLIPNLTVAENLFLGRERATGGFRDIAAMNDYTRDLLDSFRLRLDVTRPVGGLSHPEKQLLEVIANLDSQARFLILDEPTTALDGQQSAALLAGGRVIHRASGGNIRKQDIVAAIVGDAPLRPSEATHQRAEPGEVFLRAEGVAGQRLKGATLEARRGEIIGLYGLVSSGRTRFLRTLYGLEPMLASQVTLGGREYRPGSPGKAIAAKVAFLTEERKIDGFIPLMSAYQNIVLSTLGKYRSGGLVNWGAARAEAKRTLARIGTHGRLDQPVRSLSGGNQQKVLLGRIIEQDAELILLDEPTKGVDSRDDRTAHQSPVISHE